MLKGPFEKVDLLIVQGTTFCNIDCYYCYLPDRNNKGRMAHEILRKTLIDLDQHEMLGDRLTCLWHSGEPLSVGHEYMEAAFKIAQETLPHKKVTLAVQTNGLLIDDKWIELFKQYNVDVGLSCDGPPDLHDLRRVDRRGRQTSQEVERAAHRLREANIPLSVICVLSPLALRKAADIYHYFESLRVYSVAFNIEEAEGIHLLSSMSETRQKEMVDFLNEYFSLAIDSPTGHKVREFNSGLQILLTKENPSPAYEQKLFHILSLSMKGDVSCLSPELASSHPPSLGSMNFVNVQDSDWITSLINHQRLDAVMKEIEAGNKRCKDSCGYFEFCGGGVPANKLAEHGTFDATETLACRFYVKAVIEATSHHLRYRSFN